jgi:CDP-diacylglycerol--glycerol-3-phosphate 3-phosphatidyltransferase
MHLNTPIILTFLRIALIPVLVLFFYLPYAWSNLLAVMVFVLAAVTDWADGFLARRWDQGSDFGAFLDPVADKLMVAVALVLLVERHPTALFAIAAAVIIGREIVISALREWMAEMGERGRVKVSAVGKVKTIFQMVAISFLLYGDNIGVIPIAFIGEILLYIAAALTLWSMWVYLHSAWPIMVSGSYSGVNGTSPRSGESTETTPVPESTASPVHAANDDASIDENAPSKPRVASHD